MKGVVDRIEDGHWAVILIEEVNREIVVPATDLPEGCRVDSSLDVIFGAGEIISIELDPQSTTEKERRVERLMRNLRGKKNGSRFKRK